MYSIIYEMSHQSRFNARYWILGAGALGRPRGIAWGRKREEGSGRGTHVYLWRIHFDIWQNQYNIVKLKNKRKEKKIKIKCTKVYCKDGNNNPVCKIAKETLMYRTVFWTLWRGRGWDDLG